MSAWRMLKTFLAPYAKIFGAGYGAYAAIGQAQHPAGNLPVWMLWTGVVVTLLLFLVYLFERLPAMTLMIHNAMKRVRK